jgi:hypothetical protein
MVAIPAWVWRYSLAVRALIVGLAFGIVLGVLALLGSNAPSVGLIVLAVSTLWYGAFMARRMVKYWPGAKELSGAERVTVTRAVRSGRDVDDPRLRPAVVDYSRALHAAAERFRLWWWFIVVLGVVSFAMAIFDTVRGPAGEAVVSWLYFAVFPFEIWWWPRKHADLLSRAARAEESARGRLADDTATH